MLTYFTNRTQNDYINIPLQKKYEHVQFKKKKNTFSHYSVPQAYILFSIISYACKESQKSPRLHIFKFKSFSLDLWTHMVLDSNSFVCTGNEGYVSVVHAVYVTLIACLPVLWKDPSSVVLSEVSAFSVES